MIGKATAWVFVFAFKELHYQIAVELAGGAVLEYRNLFNLRVDSVACNHVKNLVRGNIDTYVLILSLDDETADKLLPCLFLNLVSDSRLNRILLIILLV